MNARLLLRLAAALALIQGLAHGTLILRYKPVYGPPESAVIQAMKATPFGPGPGRTYWNFYTGYALFAALTCVLEAVLFFAASGAAWKGVPAKTLAAIFCVANLCFAALVLRFFTIRIPLYFDLAVAILLGWACLAG